MSEWYERAREGYQLRGLAERSVQSYLREIRLVSDFHGKIDPRTLTEEQLREYILHRRNVDKLSGASLRIMHSAFRHYYREILNKEWQLLHLIRAKSEATLPVVLTRAEVWRIIRAFTTFHNQVFFFTLYSCGLRLNEALHLQISDIDKERMMVHVRHGKGAKDRYVPLPERTYRALQKYWVTHKHPTLLFPARGRSGKDIHLATKPMAQGSVQGALKKVVKSLGIQKHVRPHTFRHSYATHLLEAGVHIRALQRFLGHGTLEMTSRYLHLTSTGQADAVQRINKLMGGMKDE